MNHNYGIQNSGVLAWDGAVATPRDIRKHVGFAFTFEVTAAIVADAVFKVQAAPADPADPCAPDDFVDVDAIGTCNGPATPGELAQFTIPAGTPVGSVCSGALPCRPDAFVQLASVSGTTASVTAIMILHGPMI